MVLGEVVVDHPDRVLEALLESTGNTIEDLAASFGGTLEEVAAALDIVEVLPPVAVTEKHQATRPLIKAMPSRRRFLYSIEDRA